MIKFNIKSSHLVGFVAESKGLGETGVAVRVKRSLITSDRPVFHLWMKQISSLFFSKTPIDVVLIHRFLILLHSDDTADIYINDFPEVIRAKVKEGVKAGEKVFLNNISDIDQLKFLDIEIKSDDAILYGVRINWRFSLYFDFGRNIDLESLYKELGELKMEATFYDVYVSADASIRNAAIDDADVLIFMEGKSDWKHFKSAANKLGIKMDIATWINDSGEGVGSDDLYKMCEHYSRVPQPKKMVFIFDRDEENILKKLRAKEKAGENYQNWGNNVYSLYLPVPTGRSEETHYISIELLYPNKDLMTEDEQGRRLYLSDEFNKTSGNHAYETSHCTEMSKIRRGKICVIDANVFGKDNKSMALAKDDFAEAILSEKPVFKDFDRSQFKPIFETIDTIIRG